MLYPVKIFLAHIENFQANIITVIFTTFDYMAARLNFAHFNSADPEISGESEVSCATIKTLLRAERPRVDLSTNGGPEKADRKRKIGAISVDRDFREMVTFGFKASLLHILMFSPKVVSFSIGTTQGIFRRP